MAGETTLRIRALEKADSGVWAARVVFAATHEVHEQTFLLSVFDPVPDPQIHPQLTSRTAEGCNVTLQCLATEKGEFNVSWKRGNPFSDLEEGSGRYRLSAEGTELHLSWRPNSSDSTVTCLLSNPVDQRNASFDLLSVCPSERHPWKMWLLLPAVLVLFLAAALRIIYPWKKRSSQGAVPLATPEKEGSPPVLQYAELRKRRSPPEGNENQDPDPLAPCLAEIPMVTTPATVYAMLQPSLTT
ncbi:PREDICTED: CD48 antigen-like [Gekko japonicus]|uniref:CD48 antigen-like n=1 Tax=Gekko japonicus TaxID=146911 RepID=A0ABM1JXF8_GEKJA|nr:PREDICTED: CD48 antigen-like [Gekko japonicus]